LAGAIAIQTELKALQEADENQPPDAKVSKPADTNKLTSKDWKRIPKNACFRSMLGIYRVRNGNYYPYVALSVPKSNLWTDHIKDQLRGKISLESIVYEGRANFEVPQDGVYTLTVDRDSAARIDGHDMGGSGDITLRKGIHEITLEPSHYPGSAAVKIHNKESREEVPLFNSWQAIQEFLNTPVDGVMVTEMSGWQPTESNRVTVGKLKSGGK
jgi:hypothetical protein